MVDDGLLCTGEYLPNPGDLVTTDYPDIYWEVTGVDANTGKWVHEVREGDVHRHMANYQEQLFRNANPPVEGKSGGGDLMWTEDMSHGLNNPTPDKGAKARAKLIARNALRRTRKIIRWTIAASISLIIILAALVVTYAYKTATKGRINYEIGCSYKFRDGYEITGKRTFSEPYTELMGWRNVNTKEVTERTVIDIKGDAISILGQYTKLKPIDPETNEAPPAEERWWGINVGLAEKGVQILKGADNYTFVVDTTKGPKKLGVVKYEDFCRG